MLRSTPASRGTYAADDAYAYSPPGAVPSLSLEIRRGETRHPRRSISSDRFLIGSGPQCDLQLGGDHIPALHCLIRFDGEIYELDAIADAPAIIVNGAAVSSTALLPGDEIEIGEFVFGVVGESAGQGRLEIPSQSADFGPPENLDGRTAEQLVDLIGAESAEVARAERNRTLGAMALLQAAQSRVPEIRSEPARKAGVPFPRPVRQPLAAASDGESLAAIEREIEQVTRELHQFSQEVSARFASLRESEHAYANGIAAIADAQQQLMARLETLMSRVNQLHGQANVPTRASA